MLAEVKHADWLSKHFRLYKNGENSRLWTGWRRKEGVGQTANYKGNVPSKYDTIEHILYIEHIEHILIQIWYKWPLNHERWPAVGPRPGEVIGREVMSYGILCFPILYEGRWKTYVGDGRTPEPLLGFAGIP